jgi:hypothetical protein
MSTNTNFNFGGLPDTLCLFCNFCVCSIDTIFILGDGLIRLLLRWYLLLLSRVRCGLVASAPGCCTAAPGSNPARHPSLGSAQENPKIFPA